MFSFLAKVIHAGMDTIFYCFALEAEYAQAQSREGFADLHACIKADIVKPVPDYLMEEKSTVIQPEYDYQNNNVVEPGKPVYNNGVEPGKPEY
jgi:vancomycin permeability regulator SanA